MKMPTTTIPQRHLRALRQRSWRRTSGPSAGALRRMLVSQTHFTALQHRFRPSSVRSGTCVLLAPARAVEAAIRAAVSRLLASVARNTCIYMLWIIKSILFLLTCLQLKRQGIWCYVMAKYRSRLSTPTWWQYLMLFTHSNILQHSFKCIDMVIFS